MARYTGPITKKSRRLKVDLVGGDKSFDQPPFPPGQHGRRRMQEKEYLTQLQEKQKARFTYGVMEKQFRRYFKEAANRPGRTGENILTILESRLDNVIYRAGLARTRRAARQLGRPLADRPQLLQVGGDLAVDREEVVLGHRQILRHQDGEGEAAGLGH